MRRKSSLAAALALGALSLGGVSVARADDVSYDVKDGVRYQVTRQVVQRPITETHYEPREINTYGERYTTEMQPTQRSYQVPVTEQQWVPGYQRTWNLFAPPVLSYRLMPVTRWETRTETVRVPVTKREVVPQKQVQHVPVTTQRVVQDEIVHRMALGSAAGTTGDPSSVARNTSSAGGTKLQNDPPR